ncbi:MAG: heparinase II/III family protein, partial [Candidatus Latescibacteria bacterium]|nr:heparinase II/III family protein [Candidatus Latescibacterota bacterium]
MQRMAVCLISIFIIFGIFKNESFAVSLQRVPYVIHDDFETGEMYAWEAYPYAQDIGYEPFTVTQKEPTHNGSKYSLAKIQRPNDVVELYEGFTKEIDLWTVNDTHMKLALFLIADRKPEYVECSLCLFDGRRYFFYEKSPDVNRWLELDIPLSRFTMDGMSLSGGEHIQAITIMAFYPVVSHIPSYTICLDDFLLNGERQRRFITENPTSTTFEMFGYSILNRHYYFNDSVDISVNPEKIPNEKPLDSVTCDVIDPSGKKIVDRKKLRENDGVWSVINAYTFKEKDARGQWCINFTGKDASGNMTEWGFRFLMPGTRLTKSTHPRALFTREELTKKMASQSQREAEMIDDFIRNPEYFRNLDPSNINEFENLSSDALTGHQFSIIRFGDGWSNPMRSLAGIAESGALRYVFTGDEQAGKIACEALLKLCAFKQWNHPWQEARGNHTYYPVGYTIGQVGISYDLLYPLLSEENKKAVRNALMEKGFEMFYRDMVEMNRMPSSVSNHIAVIVANLAIAGTAIYGDDPVNPHLEPYFSGVLAKMKRFIDRTYYPDGGYGEPIGYEDMATRDLVEALYVLERNFGIDYTTTTNIKKLYLYPLHGAYSDGTMPDYGDVHIGGRWNWSSTPFLWLTCRMKNPWTAHFSEPVLQRGRGGLFEYLWYTTGLETKNREELIPSHHFPVKGTMFLRSGWSDEGSILVFKSGPNSNHYHVDQGSLILMTNGELLLSEAGLESIRGFHAYYSNPYYQYYDTQSMGHNVMLVDGNPESQMPADYENGIAALRNYPRILHSFAGWNVDEVEGDLTCVYKDKLSQYTRSLLFVKPDIYVLYDRVQSSDDHFFSWIFHAEDVGEKSSITQEDNRVRIVRPKARLDMDV